MSVMSGPMNEDDFPPLEAWLKDDPVTPGFGRKFALAAAALQISEFTQALIETEGFGSELVQQITVAATPVIVSDALFNWQGLNG